VIYTCNYSDGIYALLFLYHKQFSTWNPILYTICVCLAWQVIYLCLWHELPWAHTMNRITLWIDKTMRPAIFRGLESWASNCCLLKRCILSVSYRIVKGDPRHSQNFADDQVSKTLMLEDLCVSLLRKRTFEAKADIFCIYHVRILIAAAKKLSWRIMSLSARHYTCKMNKINSCSCYYKNTNNDDDIIFLHNNSKSSIPRITNK
jgi:hypothetical protein